MVQRLSLRQAATFAVASLLTFTACASHSQTLIDPGKTFLLGGEQSAPLRVEGRNVGPVPVEILKQRDGVTTSVASVQPGDLFSRTFGAQEIVMVHNPSTALQARVAVVLTRDVSRLSMRYQDTPPK